MTPSNSKPDYSDWDIHRCRSEYNRLLTEASAGGVNVVKAARQVRLNNPQLFDRMNDLSQQALGAVANDLRVGGPGIPQINQDTQGLYSRTTEPEFASVWRKCGNSCEPQKADKGFDALVDFAMANRNLDAGAAAVDVAHRFPALASHANSIKTARRLGKPLPDVAAGGDQRVNRTSSPFTSTPAKTTAPDPSNARLSGGNPTPTQMFTGGVLGNDKEIALANSSDDLLMISTAAGWAFSR